jgi:GNAT superfamily N-acetyltransferase
MITKIDNQSGSEDVCSFSVREMMRGEVDFAIELAATEGWNPGLHDAECFYRTDPHGFFIGLLNGQRIGCISAISYNGVFGFIGLYIIVPEHRGKGFGMALWKPAMEHLHGHNIGLDGVILQQPNYRKSGFKLTYRNIRYAGESFHDVGTDKDVVPLDRIKFDELVMYDSRFFPAPRKRFLQAWVRMPESHGVAIVRHDRLSGYGVIRRCRQGFKVGPLFADDETAAERIFLQLIDRVSAREPIFLDVPEVNPAAVHLAERYAMSKVFETARMYTGDEPAIQLDGIFGVTTFELG